MITKTYTKNLDDIVGRRQGHSKYKYTNPTIIATTNRLWAQPIRAHKKLWLLTNEVGESNIVKA